MSLTLFSLEDKVAAVTGASRGIGRALALGLARAGADVVVAARTPPALEEVAQEIEQLGQRALTYALDVSQPESSSGMIQATVKEFGRIDILVNNAGVSSVQSSEDVSQAEWDRVMDANLRGLFFCAQAAGRAMIPERRGKIINVASIIGILGMEQRAAYCISKAGVVQLTRVLAIDWAKYNINVNAIAPGSTRTPMSAGLEEQETHERIVRTIPLGRVAEPEDMVGATIFLASSASDYVTGQILLIDGGATIWWNP